MTQDEIIEMAQECKLIGMRPHLDGIYSESLVAFAKLVAKHTLSNIDPSKFMSCQEVMEAARMAEREACAKLCESYIAQSIGKEMATAIRARKETV